MLHSCVQMSKALQSSYFDNICQLLSPKPVQSSMSCGRGCAALPMGSEGGNEAKSRCACSWTFVLGESILRSWNVILMDNSPFLAGGVMAPVGTWGAGETVALLVRWAGCRACVSRCQPDNIQATILGLKGKNCSWEPDKRAGQLRFLRPP